MLKQSIYSNITDLLINREWKKQEVKTKYDIFVPPAQLNFSSTYKLYIYNKFENSDYEREIIKDLDIISQIYKEDIDELVSIIVEDRQILSFHIDNENIINARPSIPFFDNLIHKSKELLHEVANFSVINKAHFFDNCEEAERYLNYCNFFKNDKGSLITKIQLPNKEEIKESNLFNNAIIGSQINENLIKITSFINEDIIGLDNYEPNDNFLLENRDYISVNVANKIKDLYVGIEYADIDISLSSTKEKKTTSVKELNKEKVDNLSKFSKKVREKMKEISDNDVFGKIIELKSKNVEADKNMIIVEGEIKKVKSRIIVQLSSNDYQLAVEAHGTNKTVLINGTLEKEKSQYKVTELRQFKPLSK